MKKKTKLQAPSEADEVKPRQHGPQKEKTQITIRVDKDLMSEAYRQMKEDNTRITDIIERGLILALKERDHQLTLYTRQVRFVVANATKEQQVLLRGLLIAMVEPILQAKVDGQRRAQTALLDTGIILNPEGEKLYELVCWFLKTRNSAAHADACLDYYSRYGKSAKELAELAELADL